MKKLVFITGGARSGKSGFALREASNHPGKKAFLATAEASDEEMRERIERHRRDRGEGWKTYEERLGIAGVLRRIDGEYPVIVIDCLTLWLSNVMESGLDSEVEIENLVSSLSNLRSSTVYVVSNEVGMGIVPVNELARRFRDEAGMLNRKVAALADEVCLMVAGIPVKIKEREKNDGC